MKRFFAMIFVFVAALALVACKGEEKFDVDGEFTAFEVSEHDGGPMVTSVTVTIKNGKISKFYIDALQGSTVKDDAGVITAVKWNEKTKKELKFDYGMKDVGPRYEFKDGAWKVVEGKTSEKEWFEQAELLEAKWLKDGVDSLTLTKDAEGAERIDNVAGVTLKDGGYIKLAKEAVANAKAGKVVTYETGINYGKAQIVFATVTFDKDKKATAIVIDTRQSKVDDKTGLAWNEKTKQELGFEYRMHYDYYKATLEEGDEGTIEGYKAWLKDNNELEWFEQVAKISADVVATQKTAAPADAIAGVTVVTDTYYELIAKAFAAVK